MKNLSKEEFQILFDAMQSHHLRLLGFKMESLRNNMSQEYLDEFDKDIKALETLRNELIEVYKQKFD